MTPMSEPGYPLTITRARLLALDIREPGIEAFDIVAPAGGRARLTMSSVMISAGAATHEKTTTTGSRKGAETGRFRGVGRQGIEKIWSDSLPCGNRMAIL